MAESATDVPATRRQLRIKTGVVNRVLKEHGTYLKEAEDQKLKLEKLKAEDGEEWYIKNAGNMLEENNKMIADSTNRLANAVVGLRDLVVAVRPDPTFAEDPEFLQAVEALEKASL